MPFSGGKTRLLIKYCSDLHCIAWLWFILLYCIAYYFLGAPGYSMPDM